MKVCTGCKLLKELSEFHRKRQGYQAQCKVCRTAYDRRQYHTNPKQRAVRKKSVEKYKREFRKWYQGLKNGPCVDCEQRFHPAAMQWDHLSGNSKICNLAHLVNIGNKQRVLNEIAKCELVCANCHAVRTYERTCGIKDHIGFEPQTSA